MSLLGLLILIVVAVLVAVWLAPLVPTPGGQIVKVVAWIVVVVALIYLLVGLLTGATAGVGLSD